MDNSCNDFQQGQRVMIAAFAELTTLALRAGADHVAVTNLHGRFFDGKVKSGDAFGAAAILARLWIECRQCTEMISR